jgi:rhodanese-related sulfurtransferase
MPTINRQELHDAIKDRAIVPLDAQGAGWYEREHLPTAVRARPQDLAELEHRLPGGKGTPLAVYCWSETCTASQLTAQHLIELGYRQVRRYVAGKRDWIEAGLPLEGDEA